MNSNPPWDFVALLVLVGGLLFSNPQLAQALAPYATIFFSGLIGTMWSLSRRPADREPGHRVRGALFMARIIGAAMIVTLPLAVWAAPKLGIEQERYLVAPIAFIIGAVGDASDWRKLLSWILNLFLRWKSGTPETEK
jgi:hypothetical protein